MPGIEDKIDYCCVIGELINIDQCIDQNHFFSNILHPSNRCLKCKEFLRKFEFKVEKNEIIT